MRQRLYRIIRIGNTEDTPSRLFDIVIAAAIILNVFIIFFETFDESAAYTNILGCIEFVTIVIFTVEYIARIATADYAYPGKRSYAAAVVAFIFSLYGLVDLVSFLPYWLSMIFPAAVIPFGAAAFRLLRVVRIFRMFRINRYYDAFNVITDVFREKKNQIASAVFIMLMLVIGASIIMYNLEHAAQPDQFKNAFSGIWWAVSAVLTVGYGDIYPITAAGRFVGIILAFLGVGIVAIPTGIISAGFVQQYTKIKNLEGTGDEYPKRFVLINVTADHAWAGVAVDAASVPEGLMIAAILRDHDVIIPEKDTVITEGDRVILCSPDEDEDGVILEEIWIGHRSEWAGANRKALENDLGVRAVYIKRGSELVSINDDITISGGDSVVILREHSGGKM